MANKYFKVRTNYLKVDKESENGSSNVSEVRLFEAIDYTDAQTQAIKLINEKGCMGECDVDIQKVSYDYVLRRSVVLNLPKDSEELVYWYECKTTKSVINDKEEEKFVTTKFIVEGEDLEDALDVVREYLKDEDEDSWWFTSITETQIEEVILLSEK